MIKLAAATLAVTAIASAQDAEKVLRFAHTSGAQNMTEIATVVRSIAEIPAVGLDDASRTLSLKGPKMQISAAEWVFQELDRPSAAAPPVTARVFRMEDDKGEGVVRVFHVANAATPQELQELATAVRATAEIRRLFTYNTAGAIVARGTEEQISVMEWMLQQLDQPTVRPGSSVGRERPMTDKYGEGYLRVFFLANAATAQSHQELATCVRALLEIRRLFTNTKAKAIIVRGTAGQLRAAEWLIPEMDRPAAKQGMEIKASREFLMPEDTREGVVRVFYVNHLASIQAMQDLASNVRSDTSIRRIFTYNAPRAIAVRGSSNQVARADDLIRATARH